MGHKIKVLSPCCLTDGVSGAFSNGTIDIEELEYVEQHCLGSVGSCGEMFTACVGPPAFPMHLLLPLCSCCSILLFSSISTAISALAAHLKDLALVGDASLSPLSPQYAVLVALLTECSCVYRASAQRSILVALGAECSCIEADRNPFRSTMAAMFEAMGIALPVRTLLHMDGTG